MINFRFHLVSLVAVFLALAVGIVMGYGVLGQPTIEGLQNRIDTVEARANEQRDENQALSSELDQANAAIDETAPFAVTSRLTDVPAVVVAIRDVDSDAVDRAVTLARTAGAEVPGIVWLEPRLALPAREDALALASLLGLPSNTRAADLRDAVWRVLAARLATGPVVTSGNENEDPLAALVDEGFVSLEGVDEDAPAFKDIAATDVVLAVARGAALGARGVVEGFATAAVEQRLALVVGLVESGDADRDAVLAPVRENDSLSTQVATVDNLEAEVGAVATVLALSDLGRGVVGHYGVAGGAERLVPVWSGL